MENKPKSWLTVWAERKLAKEAKAPYSHEQIEETKAAIMENNRAERRVDDHLNKQGIVSKSYKSVEETGYNPN